MIHQRDIPRVVFSLSLLIQINNKRVSYYKAAAENAVEEEMRTLLLKCAEQSSNHSTDLCRWVKAYGATPVEVKKSMATIAWEKLKSALMLDATESLSGTSGAIESETLKVYKTALALSFLPGAAINDIRRHVSDFEKARDIFRSMGKSSDMPIGIRSLSTA